MEKSKHSEEQVIKLGQKILNELQNEYRDDTLSKWMCQYLAELFLRIDESSDTDSKESINKEICDVTLRLWEHCKPHLPSSMQPLSQLKDVIELLSVLAYDKYKSPIWSNKPAVRLENSWGVFTSEYMGLSEDTVDLCFSASLLSANLKSEKKWIDEHEDFLSEEEKKVIESLEYAISSNKRIVRFIPPDTDDVDLQKLSKKERNELIVSKIESNLNEQRLALEKLKKEILNS